MELGVGGTLGEVLLGAGHRQRVAPGRGAPPPHRAPPAGHPFGAWLRSELRRRRRSGRHLAGQVGVTDETVYQWLRGTSRPRAAMYWKIAAALDLQVEVVLAQAGYDALPSTAVQ